MAMKLAFVLYKYFAFGGLQRNMLSIAAACARRGHDVRIFACEWHGPRPSEHRVHVLHCPALTHDRRNVRFNAALTSELRAEPADAVVGFNRMPGLDCYYAADPCFAAKVDRRGRLYRYLPRSRHALAFEQSVFGEQSETFVMFLSPAQQAVYERYYAISRDRTCLLPPGISQDRIAPDDAGVMRQRKRAELGIRPDEKVLLSVGSGFRTKGLDRSLRGFAALPPSLANNARFLVVGEDNASAFRKLARQLGIADRISFLGGRDDVPELMLAADLLMHPAYRENTGNVLLEAMVGGLPVVTSAVCGYAHYVQEADMGVVLQEPFCAAALGDAAAALLAAPRVTWLKKGRQFAVSADVFSRPAVAADIIERSARGQSDRRQALEASPQ